MAQPHANRFATFVVPSPTTLQSLVQLRKGLLELDLLWYLADVSDADLHARHTSRIRRRYPCNLPKSRRVVARLRRLDRSFQTP